MLAGTPFSLFSEVNLLWSLHKKKSVMEASFILASDSEFVLVSNVKLMKSLALCNSMAKLLGHIATILPSLSVLTL